MAEPPLPDEITVGQLDAEVRRDLRGLQKDTADTVARHLVAAGTLVDEDPELALEHARFARRRASRISVVREAAGIAAYHAGEWAEALGELRAARRMGGGPTHLAVMADIERGLGRPERALELARGPEVRELARPEAIELAIVAAGARRDLGELDAAVVGLQIPELDSTRRDPWSGRLFYAYADNLLAAGRESDAVQWFVHAAAADTDGLTDAEQRIAELTGESVPDDDIVFGTEEFDAEVDEADADDADVDDAEVEDIDVGRAEIDDAESDGPDVDRADVDRADVDRGEVDGAEAGGTDVDGTDVEDADADGAVELDGAEVSNADAVDVEVDDTDPVDAEVDGTDVDRGEVEDDAEVDPDVNRGEVDGTDVDGPQVAVSDVGEAEAENADVDDTEVDEADVEYAEVEDAEADDAVANDAEVDDTEVDRSGDGIGAGSAEGVSPAGGGDLESDAAGEPGR